MDSVIDYIKVFYNLEKFNITIFLNTSTIVINPKEWPYNTSVKEIDVKVAPPFIDYIITTQGSRNTKIVTRRKITSLSVLDFNQLIAHRGESLP